MSSNLMEHFSDFIRRANQANTHPAKLLVLSDLLRTIFAVELEELLPGIESKIGSKILGLRGSADLIFSNVIFEIKTNLDTEEAAAKVQLQKYFQSIYEVKSDENMLGIATDCINFIAFYPNIENGIVDNINEVSSINIESVSAQNAILWLDSFIFSETNIVPTSEDLKWRFGLSSPTYSLLIKEIKELWAEINEEEESKLKLSLWSKHMEIVYGKSPEIDAFLDHTYLVTLVKIIVFLKIGGLRVITLENVEKALSGEYFIKYGILNLIEEDFYIWIFHPTIYERALTTSYDLATELLRYDINAIDEDLFKEIYEDIIKKSERHRIGEYYTPEWLTELTIKKAMDYWYSINDDGFPSILDPACGSGTFLTNSIKIAIEHFSNKGLDEEEILKNVIMSIFGADVNPLAVIIARANYIITLGHFLSISREAITIPVFVCDTIKLPTVTTTFLGSSSVYDIQVDSTHLQIPVRLASDRSLLGSIIDGMKESSYNYRDMGNRNDAKKIFELSIMEYVTEEEKNILRITLDTLFTLIDQNRDTVWFYILNNVYAPIAFKENKFDMLISNPPWIVMRTIENSEYQEFMKGEIKYYDLLDAKAIHLYTHLEMSTLFFCKTADLYLKEDGLIAFLLPISTLSGALQHINFQTFSKPLMKLFLIYNFEQVRPIFSLPVCVLFSKMNEHTEYEVPVIKFSGTINKYRRNEKLSRISTELTVDKDVWQRPVYPVSYSVYYDEVKEGASIVPRNFWYIEFDIHPTLGININEPTIKTCEIQARVAKEPWKDILFDDRVESKFIYATLLGKDCIPFGYVEFRPIFLPLEPLENSYQLLDIDELRDEGYYLAAEWLSKAQYGWEKFRTDKSVKNYPQVINRLNHHNLLITQNPSLRYVLIYNCRGANAMPTVVDKLSLTTFESGVSPLNFIADYTTYFYETNNEELAHYLCAVIGSNIINKAVKAFQPRGLYGPRDIGRRSFMLPIPEFDENNSSHMELAKLSKQCHSIINSKDFSSTGFRGMRNEAYIILEIKLQKIDTIVKGIMPT